MDNRLKNIDLYEDRDNDITLTLKNGNTALNITGYTFYFIVKENLTDADADALINTTVSILPLATSGIVTIPINYTESDQTVNSYFYEILMKNTSNQRITLLHGKVTFHWTLKKVF